VSATPQPQDSQFGQLDSLFEVERPAERQSVWPLLAVLSGVFVIQLDLFATLVAMPSIQLALGFDGGSLAFLIAGYSIANASLLISSGRLGDVFGPRRMYLLGLCLFAMASLGAASAQGLASLAVARTVQGVAAALIQPQVLGVIAQTYQGDASKRAFAAYAFTMGLGSVVGQLLGGLALSMDPLSLGWRGVFVAMVPTALACMLLGFVAIPRRARGRAQSLDWAGVAFSIALLTMLTAPLTIGSSLWPTMVNAALILGAPLVAFLFLRHQTKLYESRRPHMLPMRLLLIRTTQVDLLAVFCFFCGVASFHVLQSLSLQQAQGASPIQTGLVFATMAVAFMISSAAAPALAKRLGSGAIVLGAVVLIASHALNMASALLGLGLPAQAVAIFTAGLGLGAVMGPLISSVMARVPTMDAGAMSGVVSTLQASANAIGVAVVPMPFLAAAAASSAQARVVGYATSMALLIGLALFVAFLTVLRRRRS
jgi:MFS family permease